MLFGHIDNLEKMASYLPEPFKLALNYLKTTDLKQLSAGKYELDGTQIFVQILDLETKEETVAKPEIHRKYIDIQFSLEGREIIGYTPDNGQYEIDQDLLEERDVLFYKAVDNESRLIMVPGSFAIFFPEDVHRPGIRNGEKTVVRKAIVKVQVDLL